jgi:hypothetical protein
MNPYTYVREVCVPEDRINISQAVSSFYSELKTVAADLNAASDELGRSIAEIDAVLKTLNLGITVWASMRQGSGDESVGDMSYWSESIGYAKINGRWGISLNETYGDQGDGSEQASAWLFNDAPRSLRLVAIDHIVTLLQKLSEEGQATTRKIREKLADAQEAAAAVKNAARIPRKRLAPEDGVDSWIQAAQGPAAAVGVDK